MSNTYGFIKMTIRELEPWLKDQKVARTVMFIQQHHTYSPDYSRFNGSNHFELQKNMKDYHVNHNGWSDLAQHFTTFPDGSVLTGRSLELSPAGIAGNNANAICLEHLGNFDTGSDDMSTEQRDTIIRLTAALCFRFSIPADTDHIVYHHWFNLTTGARNNGASNNKSCPGTGFFGGNKVDHCIQSFVPPVLTELESMKPTVAGATPALDKYVCVTANSLNIRIQPDASSPMATGRAPAQLGAILRVYQTKNGWYKISSGQDHWVSAKFTREVVRATVTPPKLNVRTGPDTSYTILRSLISGQEVFIAAESNGWCRLNMDDGWVKKEFLAF